MTVASTSGADLRASVMTERAGVKVGATPPIVKSSAASLARHAALKGGAASCNPINTPR